MPDGRMTPDRAAIVVEALEAAYLAGWQDYNRWGHNGRTRRERIEAEAQRLLGKLEMGE